MSTSLTVLRTFAAALFAVVLVCQTAMAHDKGKLLPVDEAPRDKALVAYRTALIERVAARDADGLAGMVSPTIKLSFGGMVGRKLLRELLTGAQGNDMWRELGRVLANGGHFLKDGSFGAPYWSEADYGPDADPFFTYAVAGSHIPVFANRQETGNPKFHLSHDIVTSIDDDGLSKLVQVRLTGGREGFIARTSLASPTGYRSRFEKTATGWHLITFLAGD